MNETTKEGFTKGNDQLSKIDEGEEPSKENQENQQVFYLDRLS